MTSNAGLEQRYSSQEPGNKKSTVVDKGAYNGETQGMSTTEVVVTLAAAAGIFLTAEAIAQVVKSMNENGSGSNIVFPILDSGETVDPTGTRTLNPTFTPTPTDTDIPFSTPLSTEVGVSQDPFSAAMSAFATGVSQEVASIPSATTDRSSQVSMIGEGRESSPTATMDAWQAAMNGLSQNPSVEASTTPHPDTPTPRASALPGGTLEPITSVPTRTAMPTATEVPDDTATPRPIRTATNAPTFAPPATETPLVVAQADTEVPPTIAPTATPQEVASVMDNPSDGFVMTSTLLENYPSSVTVNRILIHQGETVHTEIDWRRADLLVGADGHPLPLGIYLNVPPIDSDAWGQGGTTEAETLVGTRGFAAGIITDIAENDGNYIVAITVPIEATGQLVTVYQDVINGPSGMVALDSNGQAVPCAGDTQIYSFGNNVNSQIVYHANSNSFSFPTANGPSIIRVGDPILARFSITLPSGGFGNMINHWSGDRTPEQWIRDLMDADSRNNGKIVMYSQMSIAPYIPYTNP